jgi:hypothetical protein
VHQPGAETTPAMLSSKNGSARPSWRAPIFHLRQKARLMERLAPLVDEFTWKTIIVGLGIGDASIHSRRCALNATGR